MEFVLLKVSGSRFMFVKQSVTSSVMISSLKLIFVVISAALTIPYVCPRVNQKELSIVRAKISIKKESTSILFI
jgi:hypothetical protein